MGVVLAVEGPDCVGKTSLLDELQRRPPFSRWPRVLYKAPDDLLRDGLLLDRTSMTFLKGLVTMKRTMSLVMDRCYVSNYVYGKVTGRYPDQEAWDANVGAIAAVARSLRPVVVFLYAEPEELVRRLGVRGDRVLKTKDDVERVCREYQEWYVNNPFGDTVFGFYMGRLVSVTDAADAVVRCVENLGVKE